MKPFHQFLIDKGYAKSTINRKLKHFQRFNKWLQQEKYQDIFIDYPKALQYLGWERSTGITPATLFHYFSHVRNYFDFLKEKKLVKINPFEAIVFKKKLATPAPIVLQDLLNQQQLELIYNAYIHNHRLNIRDKILLGLLIFQGIAVAETTLLEVQHLDLDKATIHIPPSTMYAARTLALNAKQILSLAKYANNKTPTQLLISYKNTSQAQNSRLHMSQQIRKEIAKQKLDIDFINFRQIRRSMIVFWVKKNNLRQAQYLAGHRSIFTTEQYQVQKIEELVQQVNKYHPLEQIQNKEE